MSTINPSSSPRSPSPSGQPPPQRTLWSPDTTGDSTPRTPMQNGSSRPHLASTAAQGKSAHSAPPKTRRVHQIFSMDPHIAQQTIRSFELSQTSRNIKAGFARLQARYASILPPPRSRDSSPIFGSPSSGRRRAYQSARLTRHASLEGPATVLASTPTRSGNGNNDDSRTGREAHLTCRSLSAIYDDGEALARSSLLSPSQTRCRPREASGSDLGSAGEQTEDQLLCSPTRHPMTAMLTSQQATSPFQRQLSAEMPNRRLTYQLASPPPRPVPTAIESEYDIFNTKPMAGGRAGLDHSPVAHRYGHQTPPRANYLMRRSGSAGDAVTDRCGHDNRGSASGSDSVEEAARAMMMFMHSASAPARNRAGRPGHRSPPTTEVPSMPPSSSGVSGTRGSPQRRQGGTHLLRSSSTGSMRAPAVDMLSIDASQDSWQRWTSASWTKRRRASDENNNNDNNDLETAIQVAKVPRLEKMRPTTSSLSSGSSSHAMAMTSEKTNGGPGTGPPTAASVSPSSRL